MTITKQTLSFICAAAMGLAVTIPAKAADLIPEPPPPIMPLRPATYDWSGVYVGAFAGSAWQQSEYAYECTVITCACTPVTCSSGYDIPLSGRGFVGGVYGGVNYQMDEFLIGAEADWGRGGKMGKNSSLGIKGGESSFASGDAELKLRNMYTVRGRVGYAAGNTLLYVTGGFARMQTDFGITSGIGTRSSHKEWKNGWVVGGGIEHALTDSIHAKLEYLYIRPKGQQNFAVANGSGIAPNIMVKTKAIQTVRAGISYNFSW